LNRRVKSSGGLFGKENSGGSPELLASCFKKGELAAEKIRAQ
jgi:hypothetical protein